MSETSQRKINKQSASIAPAYIESENKTTRPTSRKKRVVYSVILLTLTVALIEFVSFVTYWVATKEPFSFSYLTAKRNKIVENAPSDEGFEVAGLKIPWDVPIQPYYGFGKPDGFDFLQQPEDGVQNDPNGVIVAITGGSVAFNFYHDGKEELRTILQDIPKYKGKNIHVILLGYFAWKQPQQAAALMYYLTMGGNVDIVINLDGHNEIVDSNTNVANGVFLAYPWLWYYLATNTVSPAELRLIGEIRFWKSLRYSVADFANKATCGISANVAWYFLDRIIETRVEQRNMRLSDLQSESENSRPFRRFGPDRHFESLEDQLK